MSCPSEKEIAVVDFQPVGRKITIPTGTTILKAAQNAGIGISAICGGESSCGSCRVILSEKASVSPLTSLEIEKIKMDDRNSGIRLACQTKILDDIKVVIPPNSLTTDQRMQFEGDEASFAINPTIKTHTVQLESATSFDQGSDWLRLSSYFKQKGIILRNPTNLAIIRRLSPLLRENSWKISVVIKEDRFIHISNPQLFPLGLAVDIGTTKIAAYLVDLNTGKILARNGIMNPQIAFGEDIMARISYAMKDDQGAEQLQTCLINSLNVLVKDLINDANGNQKNLCREEICSQDQIVEAVIVGNTAIHHFFLGLPVSQLGVAPYVPSVSSSLDFEAKEVNLELAIGAEIHLLPNIAGFIGADHVAMLLASIQEKHDKALYIDIGTNTEITLLVNGRMIACSTASGPAFEGAHISNGMRAIEGAIEKVKLITENRFEILTIKQAKPIGICGSGVLDIIAELLKAGILDSRGALDRNSPLVRQNDKGLEVLIVPDEKTGHGADIVLTRKDISEIQLAKGAIRAGIELLLAENHLKSDDVNHVVIAGAFGTYLDVANAITIGMLPDLSLDKFSQVGNAAGVGAKMALLSQNKRELSKKIAGDIQYLELANHRDFTLFFTKAIMFQ
ncbi:DUF4445 domain-containing protein [bacterium]|nr:DUF4445 domain-containing protein [bacterium]